MNITKNALRSYKDINEYNEKKVNECPIIHAIKDSNDVFFCKSESILIIKTSDTFGLPIIGNEEILRQPCKMYIDGIECEVTTTPQIELVELENGDYKEYEIKYVFNTNTLTNCHNLINLNCDEFLISPPCHEIDLTNFDTSNVTDMSYMFYGETSSSMVVSIVGLYNLNTSNVTNMSHMFDGPVIYSGNDIANFDTSNVTDMSYMFRGAYENLTRLDISNFNTSNVTNMESMFEYCTHLTSLDFSNFDTSKVTNMKNMFKGCSHLSSLNITKFDTFNVINMNSMFYNCTILTSITFSDKFDTSNVTDMGYMFYKCNNLFSSNFNVKNFNTFNVINMTYMFFDCRNLTSLDLSNWNTSKLINMTNMFNSCTNLISIKFGSNSYVYNVTSYDRVFTMAHDVTLILCENTKESWETLLSNINNIGGTYDIVPSVEYIECN